MKLLPVISITMCMLVEFLYVRCAFFQFLSILPMFLVDAINFLGTTTGEGGTLRMFGWGCAAETLEPLVYTRASSAEFCDPILD